MADALLNKRWYPDFELLDKNCFQAIFCAPCVYTTMFERATNPNAKMDECACCCGVPFPENPACWGVCCLFVLADFMMPLTSCFCIRPKLRKGKSYDGNLCNDIYIELCSGLCCAPCAMNNARLEYMGKTTEGGLMEY